MCTALGYYMLLTWSCISEVFFFFFLGLFLPLFIFFSSPIFYISTIYTYGVKTNFLKIIYFTNNATYSYNVIGYFGLIFFWKQRGNVAAGKMCRNIPASRENRTVLSLRLSQKILSSVVVAACGVCVVCCVMCRVYVYTLYSRVLLLWGHRIAMMTRHILTCAS